MHLFRYILRITVVFTIIWILILGVLAWRAVTEEKKAETMRLGFQVEAIRAIAPDSPQLPEIESALKSINSFKILKAIIHSWGVKDYLLLIPIILLPVAVLFLVFLGAAYGFAGLMKLLKIEEPAYKFLYLGFLLATIVLSFSLYIVWQIGKFENRVTLPFFEYEESPPGLEASFKVRGSFISSSDSDNPVQTSSIYCSKRKGACMELHTFFYDSTMDSDETLYNVFKWDDDNVIAYNVTPLCSWYLLSFDRKTKQVTEIQFKKPGADRSCWALKDEPVKMLLTDGIKVWKTNSGYKSANAPNIDPKTISIPAISYDDILGYDETRPGSCYSSLTALERKQILTEDGLAGLSAPKRKSFGECMMKNASTPDILRW